jgi:hypothetical protein
VFGLLGWREYNSRLHNTQSWAIHSDMGDTVGETETAFLKNSHLKLKLKLHITETETAFLKNSHLKLKLKLHITETETAFLLAEEQSPENHFVNSFSFT